MAGNERTDQVTVISSGSASAPRSRKGLLGVAGGIALVTSLFAASSALAQNCTTSNTITGSVSGTGAIIGGSPASISSMIGGAITASSTAFLLQSEAFIGAPPNPAPNQQGAGIWVRGVGGDVDIKSTTSSTAVLSSSIGGINTALNCNQKVDTDFTGVQFGSDFAKLNWNGWNVHVGTTAGYIGTKSNLVGGAFSFPDLNVAGSPIAGGGPFTSKTDVPFFGGYVAITNGGFFIDGLLREEYYQTSLTAPGDFLSGQSLDAHGWAFAGSTGYNWQVPNSNWFIEPSAGLSISRIHVDPYNFVTSGTPCCTTFSETLQLNEIRSDIGRVGLRVGDTIQLGNVIWQPFAAVSVWHEFGPNVTASAATCSGITPANGCVFFGTAVGSFSDTSSTSTIGTFGQYSLGLSGALAGTGWLGFARLDYRDGSDLQGLSGTGGIRYQFTPSAPAVMPLKGPAPVTTAVNWAGWYVGGFGGANLGDAHWGYAGGSVAPYVGGFAGGGDIGYNWQNGKWVYGVGGDIEGTNTLGGIACGPDISGQGAVILPSSSLFQMTCNAKADWVATATARLGYAWWDRTMIYVKGGGAWTDEKFSATCNLGVLQATNPIGQQCINPSGVLSTGLAATTDRTGWTVGYGGEFALTQSWAAVAETDYVSFSNRNVTASDGSVLNLGMHFWQTKIGVNYHFSTM